MGLQDLKGKLLKVLKVSGGLCPMKIPLLSLASLNGKAIPVRPMDGHLVSLEALRLTSSSLLLRVTSSLLFSNRPLTF